MVYLGDRLRRENAIGAAIATLGIVLLATYKIQSGASTTFLGFILVIASALAWGVGNVIAKRAAGEHADDMFALVVWSSLVPPLPLVALSYAFEGGSAAWEAVAHASALTWGCAIFLAYVSTLFGFASWARLLHRYPTALVAPFALLIPVSGLLSGALLLGETLAPLQAVGVAFVLAGLVVNVCARKLGSDSTFVDAS
jgi:O-acetylserine/cysteine efflux transporter